jgi:hypothetical protein
MPKNLAQLNSALCPEASGGIDMRKLVAALIVTTLLFVGCSAKYVGKTYDGPDLPIGEVGVITFDNLNRMFNNQKVLPCKLDGIRIDMDPKDQTITVKPGKHTLLFMYDGRGPLVTVEWTFNAEPGHAYLVTFPKEQSFNSIIMWLEDLTAGKRVTKISSSPLKGAFSCF